MTYVFNMHEAKTKLSKLVELAEAGQEVHIARNGVPVVQLTPSRVSSRPKFGEFEPVTPVIPVGFDLDAPLVEWEEAMASKDQALVDLLKEIADEKSSAR